MSKFRNACLSVALLVVIVALPAGARGAAPPAAGGKTPATLDTHDRMFVEEAARGNNAEVALGKLAKEKAQAESVKDFGDQMVRDHGQLNDTLRQFADSVGVTLPTDVSAKQKADEKQLQKVGGARFDDAYMDLMVKEHQTDLAKYRKELTRAKNTQLKDLIQQAIPTLTQHLEHAQTVHKAVEGAKGGKAHETSMKATPRHATS